MKRKAKFCMAAFLILTLCGSAWADGFVVYWQSPQQLSDSGKQPEEERSPGPLHFWMLIFPTCKWMNGSWMKPMPLWAKW